MTKSKTPKIETSKARLDQRVTMREKVFFVVALIGTLVLFVNMLWQPQMEVMKNDRKNLKGLEQQVNMLSGLIEATKRQLLMEQGMPKEEGMKLDERTKKMLERRVVDPLSEVHATIGILGSRRFSRSVKVGDVDVGEMVERESYSVVPISLRLRGRFGAVQNYFSSIKNLNRPVVIKTFQFSRDAASVGMVYVSADLELFIPKR